MIDRYISKIQTIDDSFSAIKQIDSSSSIDNIIEKITRSNDKSVEMVTKVSEINNEIDFLKVRMNLLYDRNYQSSQNKAKRNSVAQARIDIELRKNVALRVELSRKITLRDQLKNDMCDLGYFLANMLEGFNHEAQLIDVDISQLEGRFSHEKVKHSIILGQFEEIIIKTVLIKLEKDTEFSKYLLTQPNLKKKPMMIPTSNARYTQKMPILPKKQIHGIITNKKKTIFKVSRNMRRYSATQTRLGEFNYKRDSFTMTNSKQSIGNVSKDLTLR